MSFDLKLLNGDVVIGNNGDFEIVENSDKLVQDVLKIISTPRGSNPFFPAYGSTLNSAVIGTVLESSFTENVITQELRASIENLQQLQRDQLRQNQIVTAQEQLAAIGHLSVNRDRVDARFYIAQLTIISKAFLRINVPEFSVQG